MLVFVVVVEKVAREGAEEDSRGGERVPIGCEDWTVVVGGPEMLRAGGTGRGGLCRSFGRKALEWNCWSASLGGPGMTSRAQAAMPSSPLQTQAVYTKPSPISRDSSWYGSASKPSMNSEMECAGERNGEGGG